jgi:hypothetical protein
VTQIDELKMDTRGLAGYESDTSEDEDSPGKTPSTRSARILVPTQPGPLNPKSPRVPPNAVTNTVSLERVFGKCESPRAGCAHADRHQDGPESAW